MNQKTVPTDTHLSRKIVCTGVNGIPLYPEDVDPFKPMDEATRKRVEDYQALIQDCETYEDYLQVTGLEE